MLRLLCFCFVFSWASVAVAQEPSDPKTEARERFGRGLRLFNDGDNAGALAEFERAYAISPHAFVLYNIGLVHSAMGRSADAADALGRVLANPGNLDSEKLERAKKTREAALARVAMIAVSANVEGAEVEVDGIAVGKTPFASPLRVTSGRRIVGIVAPGYAPERREVSVAGQAKVDVRFELKAFEGRLAHLELRSKVPGVDVLVDKKPIGKTPLPATVALIPGKHRIVFKRPGFVEEGRDVNVGPGATGRISVDPEPDPAALSVEGGRLALDLTESDAVVKIDGRAHGKYVGSIRLPHGPHALVVERAGFDPVQREIVVARGGTTTVRVELEPTPEYRASYESKATQFRTWGWVGVIGGVVVAGASTGYLLWNQGEKNRYLDEAKSFDAQPGNRAHGDLCDDNHVGELSYDPLECDRRKGIALDDYDSVKKRDTFGWLGVGVGAAAAITGGVLLLTGDDPDHYTHERPELGKTKLSPVVWFGGDAHGMGIAGTF